MDFPWLAPVKADLSVAIDSGRLGHAVLVAGYPGWGETSLCGWLAGKLLGSPVGTDARSMAHPDFRWVAPEDGPIRVDRIRALAEFALGTPQIASVKVAVIEDAHTMNVNAANALLKTLEEPPGAMYLVLGSHSPGSLVPTVRSRCQIFKVPRDTEGARAWLTDAAARALLEDYDGAPLRAARGAELGERPIAGLLEELAAGGDLIDELLALDPRRLSARWARRFVRLMGGEADRRAGDRLDARRAFAFADELVLFHDQVTRSSSANVRLLLERLCHHWRLLMQSG